MTKYELAKQHAEASWNDEAYSKAEEKGFVFTIREQKEMSKEDFIAGFNAAMEEWDNIPKTSKGFYVYNPAGSKPSHIHETLEEAKAEAERIFKSNLNAGIKEPIEVLEIVTKCVPEIKIKWS